MSERFTSNIARTRSLRNPAAGQPTVAKLCNPKSSLLLGFLAIATAPLLLLMDTLIAAARGWTTSSRLDTGIISSAALVFFVAILLLVFARSRTYLQQRWPQLLLAATAGLGTFAIFEVAWALLTDGKDVWASYHHRPAGLHEVLHPEPALVRGIQGPSHFTTNSLGVRGPEMPPRNKAYRILCIGGSTTECVYLDDNETWPSLVMQRINQEKHPQQVWVGNIGMSGFVTNQHLRFVMHSDLLQDVDCLVLLVGVNDFARFLGAGVGFDRYEDQWELELHTRPFWRRSSVLELARKTLRVWFVPDIAVEDAAGKGTGLRRNRRQQAEVSDELPYLEGDLQKYRERLRTIVSLCRQKGVRPIFLTQPILYSENLSTQARLLVWGGWMPDGKYLSIEKLRIGLDQYNTALQSVCRELDIECVDLSSMNGREEFFYDDAHFTEAGATEVARLASQWLLQHPMDRLAKAQEE